MKTLEEHLRGNYIKFNRNLVYVNTNIHSKTIPAFSHWTFHESNVKLLVYDLQETLTKGVYRLTDPTIHSNVKHAYGLTDLGILGQGKFFESHECNNLCRSWRKVIIISELVQNVAEILFSRHTTFLFQLPLGIKINKDEFRYLSFVEDS